MTYVENFIYHSCKWHYQQDKTQKHQAKNFMLDLINEEAERGLIRSTFRIHRIPYWQTLLKCLALVLAHSKRKLKV